MHSGEADARQYRLYKIFDRQVLISCVEFRKETSNSQDIWPVGSKKAAHGRHQRGRVKGAALTGLREYDHEMHFIEGFPGNGREHARIIWNTEDERMTEREPVSLASFFIILVDHCSKWKFEVIFFRHFLSDCLHLFQ